MALTIQKQKLLYPIWLVSDSNGSNISLDSDSAKKTWDISLNHLSCHPLFQLKLKQLDCLLSFVLFC